MAVRVETLNAHGVSKISLQAAVHPLSGPNTTKTTHYKAALINKISSKVSGM
jgi:hypothetical protein